MNTIQIEVTNACVLQCANCTRFVGHRTPYFMEIPFFINALDSLVDFPHMVGIMGGEPLLHPQFPLLCKLASQMFHREQLGLWSTFPTSHPKFQSYGKLIAETFGSIFLNNHTRSDIMHAPVLIGIEEAVTNREDLYSIVDKCWVQNSWSASINPNGAFFCEVAAAMSLLFDSPNNPSLKGWDVVPGWWKRIPAQFYSQMEEYCTKCGSAAPFQRRSSQDERDDVSPENYKRLVDVGSKKLKNGLVVLHSGGENGKSFPLDMSVTSRPMNYPDQVYKDMQYRQGIASPYGIELKINKLGNNEPIWNPSLQQRNKEVTNLKGGDLAKDQQIAMMQQ